MNGFKLITLVCLRCFFFEFEITRTVLREFITILSKSVDNL
jgi:hypothetical protein